MNLCGERRDRQNRFFLPLHNRSPMQNNFTVSHVLERLKTDKVFFREFMEAIVELIDLLKDRKTTQR